MVDLDPEHGIGKVNMEVKDSIPLKMHVAVKAQHHLQDVSSSFHVHELRRVAFRLLLAVSRRSLVRQSQLILAKR